MGVVVSIKEKDKVIIGEDNDKCKITIFFNLFF